MIKLPHNVAAGLGSYTAGLMLLADGSMHGNGVLVVEPHGGRTAFTLGQVALNDSIIVVAFSNRTLEGRGRGS